MPDSRLKYLEEVHHCPHCQERLSCCNVPPFHVGDGLGWGAEVIFICLNDDCPLYVNGWKFIEEKFGHISSYRYMLTPGSEAGMPMMVGSNDAFKGSEVDPEDIRRQDKRYQREKKALAELDGCVERKDIEPALYLVLDDAAHIKERERACELLIELNDIACIDPIRNHKFNNEGFGNTVNLAINRILTASFKKECPYCAEIIKAQAKLCQHCNKEV